MKGESTVLRILRRRGWAAALSASAELARAYPEETAKALEVLRNDLGLCKTCGRQFCSCDLLDRRSDES